MPMNETEVNELLDVLKDAGLGELVDCLLDRECFTKGGRIKRSVVQRKTGWSAKVVVEQLEYAKTLLQFSVG
jgi:hypothetical protein